MRIATGIISLLLMLIVGVQSCAVYVGGSALEALGEGSGVAQAGAVAILITLLFLLGGAFSFGLPKVALFIFIAAALLAFAVSGDFPDMRIWGTVAIVLAIMSYFGNRELKAKKLKIDT